MINTYVDINLYGGSTDPGKWPDVSPTSISEKMLVMKKYFDDKIQILNKGELLVMKNHGCTKLVNFECRLRAEMRLYILFDIFLSFSY